MRCRTGLLDEVFVLHPKQEGQAMAISKERCIAQKRNRTSNFHRFCFCTSKGSTSRRRWHRISCEGWNYLNLISRRIFFQPFNRNEKMSRRRSHNKKFSNCLALQLQVSHWLKQNSNYLQVAITLTPTMGIYSRAGESRLWGKELDQGLTLRSNPGIPFH